jgi:integrase
MAEVIQRVWRSGPRKVRRVAFGYSIQVPCRPCPHRGKKGQVAHPDGVRQERVTNVAWTEEDAEKALAARLLGLSPSLTASASVGITFGQAVDRYLQAKSRKKSIQDDTRHLTMLRGIFGAETPLAEITAAKISAWKAGRLAAVCARTKRGYAAATINRPLQALRHLLRLAHDEWEVLPSVPKIRTEKEPQGRVRWLEPDEEARLLAACRASRNHDLAAIVTVALETGLRKAELLELTWERLDLSRGVIRLEGFDRRDGTRTKSAKRREVPMRQLVYAILSSRPEPREGRVWRHRKVRTAFEHAVKAARIEDFVFHDCRHHFASWFVMRGGSLRALQEILGHADLKMTLRYSHLAPEHLRQEMVKTEGPLSAAAFSTRSAQRLGGAVDSAGDVSEVTESLGAEGGTRTPTPLRAHDPESCASANSATSAREASLGYRPSE